MTRIRIGLSGWSYAEWRGAFYPPGLRHDDELAYASRAFDTLEINGTFYGLGRPAHFRHWYDAAPRGFRFAVKGSRFLTHNKKLGDTGTPLANFFAQGVLELREKLGPVLWQLPDTLHFRPERVEAFCAALPRDTEAAARVARGHDANVPEPALAVDRRRRLRHVLEPRHASFFVPELVDILRRQRVALAISDAADWPCTEQLTSTLVYVRLHGHRHTYESRYGDAALHRWAERLQTWHAGGQPDDARLITARPAPPAPHRDVYVFFDNTAAGHAPDDARRLRRLVDDATAGRARDEQPRPPS